MLRSRVTIDEKEQDSRVNFNRHAFSHKHEGINSTVSDRLLLSEKKISRPGAGGLQHSRSEYVGVKKCTGTE